MLYVDIEAALVTWLKTALGGTRCVTELPADLGTVVPLVEIGRIGGTDPTISIDRANVDITCFAATRADARALAYQVWGVLRTNLIGTSLGGGVVLRVDTASAPAWHPYDDPAVRRFGATYQITTQTRL
jgi:hypothetical protein